MNRSQELKNLYQSDIFTPPEGLETTIDTALARAQQQEKKQRIYRRLGAVGASLLGAAACFGVLVNTSVPFAMAMGNLPILREIAIEFAYDDSIRKALEHDYVQLVKRSVTQDDITVSLEYLIADTQNLIFFYTVDMPAEMSDRYDYHDVELADNNGERLEGYTSSWWGTTDTKEVQNADFLFNGENYVPEEAILCLNFHSEDNDEIEISIAMPAITIQEKYRAHEKTVAVNQTITVEGQIITVSKIDIYPLQTRIYYTIPEDNTALLTSIPFYLTDETGERIGKSGGGVVGLGIDVPDRVQIVDTLWWEVDATYTLHLDEVGMVDKADIWVDYNTKTGDFINLPSYITPIEREVGYDVGVSIHCTKPAAICDVFSSEMYDVSGNIVEKEEDENGAVFVSGSTSWRPDEQMEDVDITADTMGHFDNFFNIPANAPENIRFQRCWAPLQPIETPFLFDFS